MKAQTRSHGQSRHLFTIGVAIFAILMMGLSQPAGAQADPVSCGFFETREDAQKALDARPELAETLDSDGNGIACEGVFDQGPPPVFERPSCGHYETQAGAQEALEENEDNPDFATSLDPDGNGIACEGVFETVRPTVVVCNTALGTLVEVSEEALDLGSLDFPFRLATEAEIAAGECAATTQVTPVATPVPVPVTPAPIPVTPGGDGKPAPVTVLPSTGTGAPDEQGTHAALAAVVIPLALILTGLALHVPNRPPLA